MPPLARTLNRLAAHAQANSRASKWRLYGRLFPPVAGERVLDVGVSSMDDLPGENYFLSRYPYRNQLTAVGIDDLSGLAERYPGVAFVQADGRKLPFPDQTFDVVHSNAVIEHVGPREEQLAFVAELTRVGKAVFITTPNRWFPLETHAKLPFLHWLPRRAIEWIARKLSKPDLTWWLLSARGLVRLVPHGLEPSLYKTRYAGWPLTLVLVCRRSGD
jgi:SAM-dependent methyltransferase